MQEREATLAARQTHVDESEMVYARRATELATGLERLADMEEREVAFLAREDELRAQEDRVKHALASQSDGLGRLAEVQAREIALAAREAEVLAREQLLRTQGEREAGSYTARSHDLDRREVELAAREAELHRAQSALNRAETAHTTDGDTELESERHQLAERERFLTAHGPRSPHVSRRTRRRGGELRLAQNVPIDVVADACAREQRELLMREAPRGTTRSACALEKREATSGSEEASAPRGDLGDYVAGAKHFDRRDRDWWNKQLGEGFRRLIAVPRLGLKRDTSNGYLFRSAERPKIPPSGSAAR